MNKSYYWGEPDTSVHFCESKYESSKWIAIPISIKTSVIFVGVLSYIFNKSLTFFDGNLLINVFFLGNLTLPWFT